MPRTAVFKGMAIGLLLFPAAAGAADKGDVTLSSILARGTDRPLVLDGARSDPGRLLAAISGEESFPVVCATPLAALLARPDAPLPSSLQAAAVSIATRPTIESERVVVIPDGRLAVHFSASSSSSGLMSTDRDQNGAPDLIDRIIEALAASRSTLVGRLGYPSPTADGERLDVFVVELGHGLEGFAVPRVEEGRAVAGTPAGRSPFIVLDSGLAADRVMSATLHQVAHLSLLSLSARAPRYWAEATASYLTLLETGDLKGHEEALRFRLSSPGRGLATDSLLLMEGDLLWPLFLAESTGDASIVRQIWQEMAGQGSDPLAATDGVLRRSGRSLGDAIREYAAWNLFTADRDDGQHYASGRFLPASILTGVPTEPPAQFETPKEIEPLGSAAFRLSADGRRGTMEIEIAAEGGRPAGDLLVFYRPWGPQPVLVPLSFDASGGGRVSIPWADAREAWILLRNDALPGGGGTRFEASAVANPYAPYDLASFTATPTGPSMLLEWTTASETALAQWNVYRGESPAGPFTRLNSVAVPAMGDTGSDMGYVFMDDMARPGRRYYYLLEGLTHSGLPQRSQVVSGRMSER